MDEQVRATFAGTFMAGFFLLTVFAGGLAVYDHHTAPIKARIQGGMTRMYTAAMSLEELRKGQENVVSWCRTGELVHK